MVEEEDVLPSAENGMPSLELPLLGAFGALSELRLRLLPESCVTLFTKKLRQPTSHLKVVVAACMTLARRADEVQSMQKRPTRHQQQDEEKYENISCTVAAQPSMDRQLHAS